MLISALRDTREMGQFPNRSTLLASVTETAKPCKKFAVRNVQSRFILRLCHHQGLCFILRLCRHQGLHFILRLCHHQGLRFILHLCHHQGLHFILRLCHHQGLGFILRLCHQQGLDVRLVDLAHGFEEATIDKNDQHEKTQKMEKMLETAAKLRKVCNQKTNNHRMLWCSMVFVSDSLEYHQSVRAFVFSRADSVVRAL